MSWFFKLLGNASTAAAEVDPDHKALRTTVRPPEVRGAYRLSITSGLTTGLAAAAPIFAFRWTDTTRVCLVQSIRVNAQVVTGFTAAQEVGLDMISARSWSVVDSGGTAVVFTGNNTKKRTSHQTSLVNDARISTTAALTAGTRTLDAQPFMQVVKKAYAAAGNNDPAVDFSFEATEAGSHFIILETNDGFLVRNTIAQGAAGTMRVNVDVAWMEANATDYPT